MSDKHGSEVYSETQKMQYPARASSELVLRFPNPATSFHCHWKLLCTTLHIVKVHLRTGHEGPQGE